MMTLLAQIFTEEKHRIERMISEYEQVLLALPKGTLVSKSVKSNSYYYLQYRQGKKTISKYIGKDSEKVEQVRVQIERRKHIEVMLNALRGEHAQARKISEG